MSTILKFDFQKRELRFSEVNYLNYKKKKTQFACGNYIFPKTRGNNNKPWTHSTPLKAHLQGFVIKTQAKKKQKNKQDNSHSLSTKDDDPLQEV